MKSRVDFGVTVQFKRNWVYETVVEAGGHAAPMGVRFTIGDAAVLEVYKDSETLGKIEEGGSFKVYFVDVLTISNVLEKKMLRNKRSRPSLNVNVKRIDDLGDRKRIKGVITSRSNMEKAKLINRADPLFLEALIESTKPKPKPEKIKEWLRAISKVAPNSTYDKGTQKILSKLSRTRTS